MPRKSISDRATTNAERTPGIAWRMLPVPQSFARVVRWTIVVGPGDGMTSRFHAHSDRGSIFGAD